MQMYVTYDLEQTSSSSGSTESMIVRGAKEFTLPGAFVGWEVGEFETLSGAKAYAVRVSYIDPTIGTMFEIVEVPGHAQNVNVHRERIPEEYRLGLEDAA